MYLEKVKIENFRGIRKLWIDFEESSTVLIGENQWGKSSLLSALWLVLGQGEQLYKFSHDDLYVPVEIDEKEFIHAPKEDLVAKVTQRPSLDFDEVERRSDLTEDNYSYQNSELDLQAEKAFPKERSFLNDLENYLDDQDSLFARDEDDVFKKTDEHIHIDLYFKEDPIQSIADKDPIFKRYWYFDDDGVYTLHWQIVAFDTNKKHFETIHTLLDKKGDPYRQDESLKQAILAIIKYNPVFRIRDSRMDKGPIEDKESEERSGLKSLSQMLSSDSAMTASSLNKIIKNFGEFFDKHLSNYSQSKITRELIENSSRRNLDDIVKRPISLESPDSIKNTLNMPGFNKSKVLVSLIAINMLLSKGNRKIDPNSKPIIIFEDIESRLHPSYLLSLWSIIEPTESQKIVTTNSGDLLSAVSLESLRRLSRKYYDTTCYKISRKSLSYEDLRRIAFHVRMNRPMAFFARTWLLVEGETEVWILTQVASILGISLPCEGIRIIEFAQCGLKPLLKTALQLGINFHVLTDGDDAGKKYADITCDYISKRKTYRYLTVLPQKDIEHFLYSQGYEDVFRQAAGLAVGNQLKRGYSMDKIIEQAIRRKSKPGLALYLVDAMQKRGQSGVPVLIAKLLQIARQL